MLIIEYSIALNICGKVLLCFFSTGFHLCNFYTVLCNTFLALTYDIKYVHICFFTIAFLFCIIQLFHLFLTHVVFICHSF